MLRNLVRQSGTTFEWLQDLPRFVQDLDNEERARLEEENLRLIDQVRRLQHRIEVVQSRAAAEKEKEKAAPLPGGFPAFTASEERRLQKVSQRIGTAAGEREKPATSQSSATVGTGRASEAVSFLDKAMKARLAGEAPEEMPAHLAAELAALRGAADDDENEDDNDDNEDKDDNDDDEDKDDNDDDDDGSSASDVRPRLFYSPLAQVTARRD